MSGVPLFPEVPGVERVSRAPSSPRSPARRSLFGPVDHELLARDFERSLRAMEEEKRERWNFDFRNHRPLPGPLHWEETDQAPGAEFYRREHEPKSQRTEPSPAESRAKKRSGEAADSSAPSMKKKFHRKEVEDTAGGSLTPPPEETPKKSKPST